MGTGSAVFDPLRMKFAWRRGSLVAMNSSVTGAPSVNTSNLQMDRTAASVTPAPSWTTSILQTRPERHEIMAVYNEATAVPSPATEPHPTAAAAARAVHTLSDPTAPHGQPDRRFPLGTGTDGATVDAELPERTSTIFWAAVPARMPGLQPDRPVWHTAVW
jgi:hypothetical protein